MGNFLDEFMNSLGPSVSNQISSNLGLKKDTTNQLISQITPLILGGLKKQMEEHGGAERVDHILNKYGDAGVLNDLGSLFTEKAQNLTPDPDLGGLLGGSGNQVVNTLANQLKLNPSVISRFIPMLAPVILGFLSRTRDSSKSGINSITGLLDRDGDGSILDDVTGFLTSQTSSTGTQKNILGSLLGSLFGGKRK
jgi:hypothetical protein